MADQDTTPSQGEEQPAAAAVQKAWGNKDAADGVPVFAPSYVNQAPTKDNAKALYEASVKVGSGTGATVGVYATTPTEMKDATGVAHSGWVLTKTGTGGRAGRIQTEVLVAMSNMEDKAADPTPTPPSGEDENPDSGQGN